MMIFGPINGLYAASQDDDEGLVLTAEKVHTPDQEPHQPEVVKEKKPIPIYLQPIEFVISSIVNAIFFWKND